MKRFIILILTALIAAASVVTAFADETANNFGRVNINMPELTVELKDTDLDDASEIEAYLGDSKLTVDDAHTYDQSQDTSRVYMLVDISATMNRYRNQVREFIKSYASRMGEKDALALVTVGNEVKVVLDETNDASKIAEKVDALKFDEDYTLAGSDNAVKMMNIDRQAAAFAKKGDTSSDAFNKWKDELSRNLVKDPAGIVSFYLINKFIGDKPLFDPLDKKDFKIIGAVTNAFANFRPNDPRTGYMVDNFKLGLSQRRSENAPRDTLVATEASLIDIKLQDKKGKMQSLQEQSAPKAF